MMFAFILATSSPNLQL